MKDLFADIIGGIVITLEKPSQVGDKITMGEYYGEVVDIGLRATKFITPDDTLVSEPNYMVSWAFSYSRKSRMLKHHKIFKDLEMFFIKSK